MSVQACRSVAWKIGPFVDGELPPGERDEVETHLETCGDCRAMALEFRRLDEIASRGEPPGVSGEEWARLWDAVRAPPSGALARAASPGHGAIPGPRLFSTRRWALPAIAAAAMLVLGIFLGSLFFRDGGPAPAADVAGQPGDRSDDTAELPEHLSGPAPESIEDDGDVIIIDYQDF